MSRDLQETEERWFFFMLQELKCAVDSYGAEFVLKNMDEETRKKLMGELHKLKGV